MVPGPPALMGLASPTALSVRSPALYGGAPRSSHGLQPTGEHRADHSRSSLQLSLTTQAGGTGSGHFA